MNGEIERPWERPIVPQYVSYFLVVGAYTAFTVALLYILFDSPT